MEKTLGQKTVTEFAEKFCKESCGTILPEMCTDCYMNVCNWINAFRYEINLDDELKSLEKTALMSGWNWDDDSIGGQKEEVRNAIEELAKRLPKMPA